MTDPDTPPTPHPPDEGISAAPDQSATTPSAEPPESPVGSPSETAPPPVTPGPSAPTAPAGGGRGGCMTTMIGLFLFIAALLGIITQL